MPKSDLDAITIIQPNLSIWPLTARELWKWREALYRLIAKEFQVRFRDTYLGIVWIILQPLISLGIFLVVLSRNQNLGPSNLPYSVFLLSGLVFWTFISNGFVQASMSLIDTRPLIVQTNLKRALLPLSILSSKLIDLFFSLLLLFLWIAFDPRVSINVQVFLLPLDILGLFLVLTGVTFAFSSLCVKYKDTRYILPFSSQILFFATPILYVIPETKHAWVLYLNPLTVFVLSIRDHIFGTHFVPWNEYGLGFGYAVSIFLLGGLVFRRLERSFADLI